MRKQLTLAVSASLDAAKQYQAAISLVLLAALHGAALVIMARSETSAISITAFLLAWACVNFAWLLILRRPIPAAVCSLAWVLILIEFSEFKFQKLWMTLDFVDLLVIDRDTLAFLLQVFPTLQLSIIAGALVMLAVLVVTWRYDPFRVRRSASSMACVCSLGALVGLSLSYPTDLIEDFIGQNYVSKFARTGVEAVHEMLQHGYLEADTSAPAALPAAAPASCHPPRKLPHIILVHDESSFDITALPSVHVPPGYLQYFKSQDGNARKLVVEGAGGPSWFTEYNVLTGLSARSFGRFATSVTRIAAGRVKRGLPRSLRRCGYTTFTLYPFYGAFLGSRGFQTTAGIGHYLDMRDIGTRYFEPDSFYFDQAAKIVARERGHGPLFLYVYTVANHFPWDTRLRPELTPDWRDLGNASDVDEYIRRQTMTAHDYRAFLRRLATEYPTESFLVVRYGDHLPSLGLQMIDPSLGEEAVARRLQSGDPRYFTTYYALDGVNFAPAELSSAMLTLDAAYLPLVIQEAAGVPLEPTFLEQKKILLRCQGLFYRCAHGAEARRFNRMLIDAGFIVGL